MNMVWVAILVLFAGIDGRPALKVREVGRPAEGLAVRVDPVPSRSPSVARRVERRPCSAPWSSHGLDEYDTEEEDDSWVVHLDALASVPIAWCDWARPESSAEARPLEAFDPPSLARFPLRC